MVAPAEKSATSRPVGVGGRGVLDGVDLAGPAKGSTVPAERAEAKNRTSPTGKPRSSRIWRIATPT